MDAHRWSGKKHSALGPRWQPDYQPTEEIKLTASPGKGGFTLRIREQGVETNGNQRKPAGTDGNRRNPAETGGNQQKNKQTFSKKRFVRLIRSRLA